MMNGYELGYNGYQYGLYWLNDALLDISWDLQWGSLRFHQTWLAGKSSKNMGIAPAAMFDYW